MGEMDATESQPPRNQVQAHGIVTMHADSDRIILDRVLPVFLGIHRKLPLHWRMLW